MNKDDVLNLKQYLLICLAEECAEVQKDVTKSLRFGLDSCNPIDTITHEESLIQEMIDVLAIFLLLQSNKFITEISPQTFHLLLLAKQDRVMKTYNDHCGVK